MKHSNWKFHIVVVNSVFINYLLFYIVTYIVQVVVHNLQGWTVGQFVNSVFD